MYSNLSKEKKNALKIKFDFNNMMFDMIGEKGISEKEIEDLLPQIEKAKKAMVTKRAEGKMDFRDLPYVQNNIVEDILNYVKDVKDDFDTFVVLGIGGSALGPMAVQQAINHPFYNELSKEKRNGFPKIYILDNIDPERLVYLFDIIDIKKTLFNCISKSGSTSETMSQFMIVKDMLEKELGTSKNNIVCTTDAKNGNLIRICAEENYKYFVIPDGVGGRFSELTPVGLLPAAMCGIDIKGMLAGAEFMDEICKNDDIYKNPAFMYAILSHISINQGKNISVVMPYADSLKYISDWYAQLWAESLGKKFDNDNNIVNVGPTPVKALGVTDQHSQVQLYAEGPFDKYIVFIGVDEYKETIMIPKTYQDIKSLGFLGGVTQNELIKNEQLATEHALMSAKKANMNITLPMVNEFTLGQLLYMFEVATAFIGELLNINAFDQPGVEAGKNATYALFGREGYEEVKKEIDNRPSKSDKFLC